MVQRVDFHTRPAFPRECTQFDSGFGIDRESQHRVVRSSSLVDPLQLLEDVVRFWELFLGWLLRTARK